MFKSIDALAIAGLFVALPALAQNTPAPPPSTPPAASSMPAPAYRAFPSSRTNTLTIPSDRLFANSKFYVSNYQQVQSFGRCVTNVGPKHARYLLDSAPNTAGERAELRRLTSMGRACLPYGYTAPVIFLRGGIAEAMYRQQSAGLTTHAAGSTDAQVVAFQGAEARRSQARLADDRLFTTLANCLVIQAPVPVRALLLSDHGSAVERKALSRVLAGSPGCTTGARYPANGAVSFMRAYIAESAYRWAAFGEASAGTAL